MTSLAMLLLKKVPVIMAEHREVPLAVDLVEVRAVRLAAALAEHRAIPLAVVSMARTVMAMVIMNIILKMEKIWMIS